jgi:glycosyltransferase involved in cell wall biosynthesis
LKIIYLHQYFTTPKFNGGVRSYQFAKRMVESGHQVDLVTSSAFFSVIKPSRFQFISTHLVDGINVHVIHIRYDNKMALLRRVIAFLLFMLISSIYVIKLQKRDLVFATSTPLTIGVPALVAKFIHRIPLVFEVRDLWPDVPIAMGFIRNPLLVNLLRWFEMLIYRQSAKIVALSDGMKVEILNKGVDPGKVVVVQNACDIEDFETQEVHDDVVARYRPSVDTKICIYAGTFGYVNDLSYLVELASELKRRGDPVRILLIGDGVEKQKIVDNIRREHLEDWVFMQGPVSKGELISYIQSADACVSTVKNISALFNNSANKFFDALAAGRPIIINHKGWQAEVIEKNDLGIVLDWDIEKSAERLSMFFSSGVDSCYHDRVLLFAKENYSRDLLFDKLIHEAIEAASRIS